MPIDLSLNQDQLDLQASAHDYFQRRCPSSVVREVEEGELGYLPDMWEEMAALDWLGITFPEEYGGSGRTFLDLFPIYEEMGRFLVPSPHLDTVAVAGETILAAGDEAQKQRFLPAIANGTAIIVPAVLEASGTLGPAGIELDATPRGGDYVLGGTKLLVGFVPSSDYLLCAARTAPAGGQDPADGVTLFLVETRTTGVSWTATENIAGMPLFAVEFDNVVVPAAGVLGEVGRGWEPLDLAMTKAAVLQTATIVGSARSVLDMTNRYAQDRKQFGSPIGQFQAVQYLVTDVLIDMHRTDLLARQASYRIDAGKPFAREAALAIAFGKQAAAHLHRQAHEVHAGMGFMMEYDLQLFSRRSKYWENNLGDARYHYERVAEAMQI